MEQGSASANVVPLDSHTRGSPWEAVLWRLRGRTGVLIAFTLCHALLVCLGYALKEQASDSALLWPSMGLLLTALWIADRSFWIPLLLAHTVVELAIGAWLQEPFVPRMAVFYVFANALAAVVGALLAHRLIDDVAQVRTLQVLQLMFAMAVGALAGALPGAWVNLLVYGAEPGYLHQLQMWWVANWLGALSTGTVVFCWLIPIRLDFPQLALRSRVELAVLAALLVAATLYVFQANPQGGGSLLQLPVVIVALLAWAACRLPPRWAATLAMMTTLSAAWLAAHRAGPFMATDPLARALQVQTFLAACSAVAFVISTSLAEKSIALGRLRESETRYRHFVEVSNEAVWRVELDVPMPVTLPEALQVEWLRKHARVVECNQPFQHMEASADPATGNRWDGARPWCAAYEQQLALAAKQGFSVDDLRFSVHRQGRPCVYLTSYCGVVHEGRLQRIWGVARDITELVDLNARLLRDQDRLKSYARQIVTAEEKARRATAVDLHDGIGQSLVGMAMTLEVAREHAPPEVRLLVDEVRARLREVQERTRHMISDLSPPGLYDLGLAPALQWLAVYMRGHDQLHVELDARLLEESVKLDMRVLVFKLVRELLRNVVKHAGVSAAAVRVAGDAQSLRVEVSDQGKGFEWQMDMFGGRSGGFGLWSIADRVNEAGGQFKVDTAPGRGSRFELVFPLRATGFTGEQPGLRAGRPA